MGGGDDNWLREVVKGDVSLRGLVKFRSLLTLILVEVVNEVLDIGGSWISATSLIQKSVPGFIGPLVACDATSVRMANCVSGALPA